MVRQRELVTDIATGLRTLFARVLRIGLLVSAPGWCSGSRCTTTLIAFYRQRPWTLAALPLWLQGVLFLVLSDFMLYCCTGCFTRRILEISRDSPFLGRFDWISAARFHPVNLFLAPSWSTSSC